MIVVARHDKYNVVKIVAFTADSSGTVYAVFVTEKKELHSDVLRTLHFAEILRG